MQKVTGMSEVQTEGELSSHWLAVSTEKSQRFSSSRNRDDLAANERVWVQQCYDYMVSSNYGNKKHGNERTGRSSHTFLMWKSTNRTTPSMTITSKIIITNI